MRTCCIALLTIVTAAPASAEVVKSRDHGFELRYSQVVPGPPAEALEAFSRVGDWWDGEHTYSGSAANLSLALQPGGCFCERLPGGGGIEHMRVSYLDPGKRLVMTGGLGPLLYEAVAAVMDVQFKPAGTGTQVLVNFRAAGFANGGADKLAPLVDKVLGDAVSRYGVYATPPAPAKR